MAEVPAESCVGKKEVFEFIVAAVIEVLATV
jgi:hypothetical protein